MISQLSGIMYSEHANILEAAQIALSLDKIWESDPNVYEQELSKILDFFSSYADKFHHYKEEKILFPVLRKSNESSVTAIVIELLEHHDLFRDAIGKIRNDLSGKDYAGVQQKLKIYINDLKDHIAAENDELFPMTDQLFSADELEKLYFQCIDIDFELGIVRKEDLENYIQNHKLKFDEAAQ